MNAIATTETARILIASGKTLPILVSTQGVTKLRYVIPISLNNLSIILAWEGRPCSAVRFI